MAKTRNKYFEFDRPVSFNGKNVFKRILSIVLYPYWKLRQLLFAPHKMQEEKKYNVSICAIFRNEAPYLREWIEYHRIVGVDHFYVYNNFSQDGFEKVLDEYVSAGIVTLMDWPVEHGQMSAYNDCVKRFSSETKWIGFIDLDEYVVPNQTNTIYGFLKRFEKNCSSVIIYWKFFGSSGMLLRDVNSLITESFIVSFDKYSAIGKLFFNTAYDYNSEDKRNWGMHTHWSKYKGHTVPPVNEFGKIPFWHIHRVAHGTDRNNFPIQINHYVLKSYAEYINKGKRGSAFAKNHIKDDAYFFFHEDRAQSVDYHVYKYLIKLKKAMQSHTEGKA